MLSYFEAVSQGVISVSSEGRIMLVNRATEEMFGYHRSELVGQPLELLLPARFRDKHVGHRDGYFSDPHVRPMGVGMDLAGRRKDGSEFPVEIGLSYTQTG
jgi:rsbT co-antagonist protein RsbR